MKKIVCLLVIGIFLLGVTPFVSAEIVIRQNADVTINVGESYTLEAVIKSISDSKLPSNVTVKWETTNSKVATVAKGVVKGISEGGVVITASAISEGRTYSAKARVFVQSMVTKVHLNKKNIELRVGQEEKLIETVLPEDAMLKTVVWKSDNTKVATVSRDGVVKGVSEGYAAITVTTNDGGYTETCNVRAFSTVKGVALVEHSLNKKVGEEFTLDYSVLPSSAFLKDVRWKSSNTKVVSISRGTLKAVAPGTAYITIETVDGNYQDDCVVRVSSTVTGITLNKDKIEILKGNKETVVANIEPADAVEKGVTWKSEDTKIASVRDGVINGVNDGETIVTATTKDGNYTAQVTVVVISYDVKVESIKLVNSEVFMNCGENRWFLYKTYPEDAVVPKLKVTYTLLNDTRSSSVQIRNNAVYLEANKPGKYILTVCLDSNPTIKDTCIVNVKSMVTGVEISNTAMELLVGEKKQLTGRAIPDSAIIKGVTWSSTDPKIAKINKNTGEIEGVSEGSCIIIATTIDGDKEATCRVTVKTAVNIETIKIRGEDGNIIGEKPAFSPSQPSEQIFEDADTITITKNGIPISTDQPPILLNGRVLAPVRAIFESFGAVVYWNEQLETVTGVLDDKIIQLTIENTNAYLNGESFILDVPAKIVNGRTLVPVRFIAESLGVNVDWDESTHTVIITE